MTPPTLEPPWYRQLWPWLLMLMPATAVVGGLITYWLASTTNNALVVDDYYREGRAINLELARDRHAVDLGLAGSLTREGDGHPRLRLQAATSGVLPQAVTLRLVHATRAELDRTITMQASAEGDYGSPQATLPDSGRWNIQIEDRDRRWRLVGVSNGFGVPVTFGPAPR